MKRTFYVTLILLVGLLSAYAEINVYASAPTSFIRNPFLFTEWTGLGSTDGELFGTAVAAAGDVNGDGFADILVGAPIFTNVQDREGRAYAFYGSASGLPASPDWTFENDLPMCELGWNVATAGDVNNDGFDDVLVASEFCSPTPVGDTREGRVYLFLGSASGLSSTYDWMAEGYPGSDESFGWSIASAGDINGDGFDDVVIGAPWADYVAGNAGRAYIYYGSASGLPATPSLTIDGDDEMPWTGFGESVDSAGDVDNDGYDDVIIGWPGDTLPVAGAGIAYIYPGSSEGLVITPTWSYQNDLLERALGGTVAGVGDVNGDGFGDVMVAAKKYANPDLFEGIVYLFLGSAGGPSTVPDWHREGNQPYGQFGWDIQSAGDVNADGFGDVLIGSPFYDHGEVNEGMGFLFFGSSAGLLPEPV